MHSTRTTLLTFFLTILSLTHALVIKVPSKDCSTNAPAVPSASPIPLPTTNLTLSHIALGRGIQNYTCLTPTSVPLAIGAIATLYDVTTLGYLSPSALNALPPLVVNEPLPFEALTTAAGVYKVLGNHYFDVLGVPTFKLTSVGKVLYGAKTGDVSAPAGSSLGPDGTGAVDWLQLIAKTGYTESIGLKLVYRVVTAGGMSPACTEAGTITVPYAAEYWFYD